MSQSFPCLDSPRAQILGKKAKLPESNAPAYLHYESQQQVELALSFLKKYLKTFLIFPIFGPLVNTSKENFETQTVPQYLINKTFGGTAGQHLWTIVDP